MNIKKSMTLNQIITEIKNIIGSEHEELFIDSLGAEEKVALKNWANGKTELYLINQLKKHYKNANIEEYKKQYKKADLKYNILIDIIDYNL